MGKEKRKELEGRRRGRMLTLGNGLEEGRGSRGVGREGGAEGRTQEGPREGKSGEDRGGRKGEDEGNWKERKEEVKGKRLEGWKEKILKREEEGSTGEEGRIGEGE